MRVLEDRDNFFSLLECVVLADCYSIIVCLRLIVNVKYYLTKNLE